MPRVSKGVAAVVRERAGHVSEYCRRPESSSRWRFVCDHVIAAQHQGMTSADNLALCCSFCNRHKGPNVGGVDPVTREVVPLFNPRCDLWREHFRWDGATIVGTSPAGRATVVVLAMNDPKQLFARVVLIADGRMSTE